MPLPPIVYEDDTLIAFDKPSGLLIAPDRWDKTRENLMTMVHARLGQNVANVHRLDADTSGIVLCTKTKGALDFVSGQFQGKTVGKKYLALAVASPAQDTFTVDLPLGDDPRHLGRMRVQKKTGKPCVTEFSVLERFGRWSFLECRPLTGRTHQIRVHLQVSGHPILNDPFYGDESTLLLSQLKRGYKGRSDEKPLIGRLALHAGELTIKHPETKEALVIHTPMPNDFEVALKYLRKFSAV
ncbi:MAG TPA: RluA family pseudouridine synthase [Opitutaceae bacterium]|nr:RluA family pseudouridine synthase [Opitutaceae bacterium]